MSTAIETITGSDTRNSLKRIARIAGVFYLFVAIFGGFSQGFVDTTLYVAGDAAATTELVLANAGLLRLGVVAHLTNGVFFVLTALALYVLLSHVHKGIAQAMLLFVALAAGMTTLNAVFQFEALQVATSGSSLDAFGATGTSALVLMLLDIQHYGILSAQVFFGLWLAPLGYLAYRSGLFPKALGLVLVAGAVSYMILVLTSFLLPDVARQVYPFTVIAPLIGEVWMVIYLLVIGVRTPRPATSSAVAVSPVAA